jgi:hypothetical protein
MGPDQPSHDAQPFPSSAPHLAPKKKSKGKMFLKWLAIVVIIVAAAAGGWYYRDMQAKDDIKAKDAEIAALKANNAKLKSDLEKATTEETTTAPSQEDLDNIEAAVKSGNYAALEQLMHDKVTVIIAASEGLGERTPAQAVADLAYINNGTDPWDCDLPAATIDGYQAGDYKQYFPEGSLVCKSANGYVVSFSFDDSDGKIKTIFLTNSEDVLT